MPDPAEAPLAGCVTIRLHGIFASLAGRSSLTLELLPGGNEPTLGTAVDLFHAAVGNPGAGFVLLHNDRRVVTQGKDPIRLQNGDVISIVPLLSGG